MFPLPLAFTIQVSRSRVRLMLIAIAHLAATFAVWSADLPQEWRLAGLGVLCASLILHAQFRADVRLRCDKDGNLAILGKAGWRPVELMHATTGLRMFILIRYREPVAHRTNSLLILPESVSPQDYRRLQVWLRWLGNRGLQAAGRA